MATTHWWLACMVGTALGCASTTTVPAEPRQEPAPAPEPAAPAPQDPDAPADPAEDPEAMMKAWAEATAPGEHHAHLALFVGEWDTVTTSRPAPDAPTHESRGSAHNALVLGGRFLKTEYDGSMEMAPGQEIRFEGINLLGYDKTENWHRSVWCDSFDTQFLVSHGTCDDNGRRIMLVGTYKDPMSGEPRTMRSVYRVESDDRYVLELYMPDNDGREFLAATVVHTRRP